MYIYLLYEYDSISNTLQGALSSLGTEGCTLEGKIPFGRFGHSIVRLGDINGDDLEGIIVHCVTFSLAFLP